MLREATQSDLEKIRRWRNHPRVRSSSIFTAEITPEGHARWWAEVQADESRQALVFSHAGNDAGVVLFNDHDRTARTAEWGFFLDVDGLESRSELMPAWVELEREAVRYAFEELMVQEIGGRTLAWNRPVLALHKRLGFIVVPERGYETVIDGSPQRVVWTARRAELPGTATLR